MVIFSEVNPFKRLKIENIVSLMKPCYILSRIHGIHPYSYSNVSISLSKSWYFASLIIMAVYLGSGVFILYQIDVSGTLRYEYIPGLLQGNSYVIISAVLGFWNLLYTVPRLSFLQSLLKISSNIPKEAFQKIGLFIYIKDIFGFIFLVGQIPNIYDKNIYVAGSKAHSLFATLLVFLTDGLYMNIVSVLLICFKNINNNLIKLKNNIIAKENQLLVSFFHERNNSLSALKLHSIKEMHFAISEVVEKLNSTFSFPIVASLILTFAEVTFSLYFYLLHTRSDKKINLEKQIWYSYFITSVSYYSVKLTALIWVCQLNKNEVLTTGSLVHEILLNTDEPQFKDELQLFSLQILQRDNSLKARGISLDASLLTKVLNNFQIK
ncbi:uncharacterized protein LOC122501686 [Leptopilina heterotoma]|uniref:uncharacterized protein LOC122501686 n=1 Tax=Leptopilina heterotoma TaxID=63436 RepID=UPI001CA8677F|nr:uncharacterized protein LOC122501686 [Leptopilina heterotoma]